MMPLASGIVLFLVCCFYSLLVEYAHRRWPSARHYTFAEVVLGCAMVIVAASVSIGWDDAVVAVSRSSVSSCGWCGATRR